MSQRPPLQRIGAYRAAFIGVCLALVLPFQTLAYAPLVDYPNHLARVFILSRYSEDSAFAAVFRRDLAIMPNLGMEAVMLPLLSFMSVGAASRVFLAATMLLFAVGCHLLARAVRGRRSWVALPCAFLVLSSPFMYGFMNYMLGVGAFLCTLAAWLRFRERRSVLRYVLVCTACLACFVIHLSTLAFLGVAIGIATAHSILMRRRLEWRDVVDGSVLLPLVAAFLVFRPRAGAQSPTIWNSLGGKAVGLLAPLRTYESTLDVLLIISWGALLLFAWRGRTRVRLHQAMLAAGAVMFVAFVVSPKELFTSSGADTRFVLPAIVLLAMSVDLGLPRRTALRLAGASLLLCVVRLAALWWTWQQLSDRTARLVEVTDRLPPRASLFVEHFESGEPPDVRRRTHAVRHAPHYATIRRGVTVSSLFAVPGVQPLLWRDGRQVEHMTSANVEESVRPYGFVWTGRAPPEVRSVLARYASVVAERDGFELWRVNRDAFPRPAPSR